MSSDNEWFKYGFKPFPRRKKIGHPDNYKRWIIVVENYELSLELMFHGKPYPNLREIFEMEK
ncbi:hypothetical protein ES708_14262 [subsurface metagenome]